MSTYSASSRTGSVSGAPHPRSVRRTPSIGHAPPPPPSHSTHHAPGSGVDASRHQHRPSAATTPRSAAARAQQQMPRQTRTPAPQRESVMERNRRVRTPSAVEAEGEDAVTVIVGIVGVKFKCLVERDWPCESLVASAIAEYHLAYPTCEVPDSSLIFHVGRKQFLEPKDPVGKWCQEGDEIELGVKDRPVPPPEDRPPHDDALSFHTYDFTIMFHRLPLGFTLKQEMDATVVANIYPKSAATHYERLVPGVVVVKIGDTPLEFLGLRQVHELIRHCKLPLPIRFRGWKKPVARRASFSAPSDPHGVTSPKMTAAPRSDGAAAPRRKSVPTRSSGEVDETSSRNGSRPRASTTPATSTENPIPTLFDDASELTAQGPQTPSPYSQTKQRLTSERKKTNASSPYPEHRAVAAGRRSARSTRGSPTLASINDNTHTNQGGSPDGSPSTVTDFKLNQHLSKQMKPGDDGDEQLSPVTPENVVGSINSMIEKFATSAIGEPNEQVPRDQCDADSNQNEEETEEMLLEHINILRSELTKKYEEAKQLASQLEKYNARLKSVHRKRAGKENTNPPEQTPTPVRKSPPKLTLTPQVLEAIDSKAGLPAKSAYAGSNASSVSGYSSYSNRSAVAKRHAHQLSRYVGRTGESSNRCDASVSSYSSATHRRERQGSFNFGDGLKSPRRQAVQNVSSRYNFMPPKYSATDKFYDAPSTFSTKGGLISKAKVTRDSYIKIPDTPGVGAYDVKLPQERVRGGEIGDSDRSLPWP